MRNLKHTLIFCSFTLSMSACVPVTGSKQTDGAIIGTGAGALIGGLVTQRLGVEGQVAGIVGGALIGGLVGGAIGASLDEQDRQQLALMSQQTLTTGSTRNYTSPRTGIRIQTRVVKKPAVQAGSTAQVCRSVEQKVILTDGTEKLETINSCRGPNGWQSV